MPDRSIIIHGHFYQPPRENPWIEEIEVQDSAAPYHDWNERITAECYGPNSAARIVGDGSEESDPDTSGSRRLRRHPLVTDIINNYAKISFNVGPTLLSYLERHAPAVYRNILEADRLSAEERGGYGNAIAQVYNHAILPLATPRDKITQVRWGIADFTRRFGRRPRGMWLAECGADEETLEVLAGEGIEFTILGQGQGKRHRAPGSCDWIAGVDPRRPYKVDLPGGRSITAFFYDGGVAHDISFGDALRDRDTFVDRLVGAFGGAAGGPWLVNVATDGETFGHHRSFGDMVLAAAIQRIERERPAALTNYAQFLARSPATWIAEIHSPSSWSCAHGVNRWREDCGCSTGAQPGWNQRWRRPLRDALDRLRDELAAVFERRAAGLLQDPWAARDAYVDVMLDRSPAQIDAFFAAHAPRALEPDEQVAALKLLEMQRHALLMYTSCGWFFGEISGPEGVQILKYAARAIQLARDLDHKGDRERDNPDLMPAFQAALAGATSNLPEQGDAARILEHRVRPSVVNLGGVVAHYAIASLFESYPLDGRIFCYRHAADDLVKRTRGVTTLAVGRVRLSSDVTREATHACFAVLHFGGHDLRCAVGPVTDLPSYEDTKQELLDLFERRSLADVVRAIDSRFDGRPYGLSDLFLDERRRIVATLVRDVIDRRRDQLFRVFEENRPLLRFLVEADTPVPGPLRAAADYTLSTRFVERLAEAHAGEPTFAATVKELERLQGEARALGASLDVTAARRILDRRILAEARELAVAPRPATARALLAYLELGKRLGIEPNVWEAQNLYWALAQDGPRGPDADWKLMEELGERLGFDRLTIPRRYESARGSSRR